MRVLPLVVVVLSAASASAQVWNSNAGGWNTGYGTVYGSFGYAMATQNIYNTTQLQIQRLTMRAAMIKQFGKEAVEKAEREAKTGKPSSAPQGLQVQAPPPPAKNLGRFKPERGSKVAKTLAEGLGGSPEEKKLVAELVGTTKQAFEGQPEMTAWRNNVAGALAFFFISNVVVANDAPEPSDASAEVIFQAFNQSLDGTPEFASMSNKDKQQLYETLLGFTGLPLAIYTEAKERGDAEQLAQARALAKGLLETVLKVDPAKVKLP